MLDLGVPSEESSPPIRLFQEVLVPVIFACLFLVCVAIAFGLVVGILAGAQGTAADEAGRQIKSLTGSFYGIQLTSVLFYSSIYVFAEERAIIAGHAPLRSLYRQPAHWGSLVKYVGAGIGGAFLVLAGIVLWSKLTGSTLAATRSEAGLMPGSQGAFDT